MGWWCDTVTLLLNKRPIIISKEGSNWSKFVKDCMQCDKIIMMRYNVTKLKRWDVM